MQQARDRVKLWFFRDLTDAQRVELLKLFEFPADETDTSGAQTHGLRHVFDTLSVARVTVDVLRIPRPASLDPIIVYFEDSAPGKGRITITCYGDAWTGAWGAMGDRTVRQFVAGVDPDYLAGSLLELRKASDHFRKYTARVAAAVIAAASQPKSAT